MKDEGAQNQDSDRLDGFPHPRESAVLLGHAAAEAELLEAYRTGRLPHAWLIGGPEGIGKATLAWRFARFILAHPDHASPDVHAGRDLLVAADHPAARAVAAGGVGDVAVLRRAWNEKTSRFFTEIRVDDVRRAASLFQRSSRAGAFRICIIDSVEDLNASGANALLKLIEEPPPLSLFLLVAHHPARVLPTIRSRARLLSLSPLAPRDVTAVLRALGPAVDAVEPDVLGEAVRCSGGSVRTALRALRGERLATGRETAGLLDRLPALDWAGVHRLADRVGQDDEAFEALVGAVLDWLHAQVGVLAGEGRAGRRLAALAEVWEKVRHSARDTEIYNLDRRAALLSIFSDLSQASRAR